MLRREETGGGRVGGREEGVSVRACVCVHVCVWMLTCVILP